jgi:hypothetical protein
MHTECRMIPISIPYIQPFRITLIFRQRRRWIYKKIVIEPRLRKPYDIRRFCTRMYSELETRLQKWKTLKGQTLSRYDRSSFYSQVKRSNFCLVHARFFKSWKNRRKRRQLTRDRKAPLQIMTGNGDDDVIHSLFQRRLLHKFSKQTLIRLQNNFPPPIMYYWSGYRRIAIPWPRKPSYPWKSKRWTSHDKRRIENRKRSHHRRGTCRTLNALFFDPLRMYHAFIQRDCKRNQYIYYRNNCLCQCMC